jgi:hypothetical protein
LFIDIPRASIKGEFLPFTFLFGVPLSVYTKALTPGANRLWFEAGHLPPASPEVKNEWGCTSTPLRRHGVRESTLPFTRLLVSTEGPYTVELFNPLSPELNPICYLLALLAHDFLHVTRIMVKSLTLMLLMLYIYIYIYIYIYMEHLFLMFLDHTTTQHSR